MKNITMPNVLNSLIILFMCSDLWCMIFYITVSAFQNNWTWTFWSLFFMWESLDYGFIPHIYKIKYVKLHEACHQKGFTKAEILYLLSCDGKKWFTKRFHAMIMSTSVTVLHFYWVTVLNFNLKSKVTVLNLNCHISVTVSWLCSYRSLASVF